MDAAREAGITLFDTANSYGGGTSEEWIGRWLASRGARDEIVLTTKVRNRVGPGPDDEGLVRRATSAPRSRRACAGCAPTGWTSTLPTSPTRPPRSRRRSPPSTSWSGPGKVRHAGLSNFSGAQVDAAAETRRRAEGWPHR